MKQLSWRHHYIPEFYLSGFTNPDGTFKIYNVQKDNYLKNGKNFSPRSIFFEKEGNSLINEGEIDDFLEKKLYSKTDNTIAEIFNRIKNSSRNSKFGVTDEDMPALQYFVSMLYWRIPKNYDQIKHLITQNELHELGLIIKNKEGKSIRLMEFEHRVKTDPNFFKMMKYWIPTVTYPRLFNCRTPLTIQSFPDGLPSICSDNPVIFIDNYFPDLYMDDFIFPITNNLILIRGKGINNVLSTIKIEIDIIVLKQAKKYVCCTDSNYIPMLNKLYEENYSTTDELKRSVFRKLIN